VLDVNDIAAFEKILIEKEMVLKKAQEVSRLGYWSISHLRERLLDRKNCIVSLSLEKDQINNVNAFLVLSIPMILGM